MLAIPSEVKAVSDSFGNGLGRIILRKNMVNGVNTLTQDMMPLDSGGSRYFVLQFDFVLGENITIPNNCILVFDGGSITNLNGAKNAIIGHNTSIQAGLNKIFGTNIILEGTWKVEYGHPEWFGACGDGINDDTEAFYATLQNFKHIFLSGRYLIDFRDVELQKNKIEGKGEFSTESVIIQKNCNIPFALVKDNNILKNFRIYAQRNTEITDVFHFGYSNGTFNAFSDTEIKNVYCIGKVGRDEGTIFFHFNMQQGGNSNFFMQNTKIAHCYIGIWFEYHKTIGKKYGWITQSFLKDITIHNPSYYGFKWDALSMYDQGKSIDPDDPKSEKYQTMWCYNNYFENIGIDIIQDGATGFYIGQGMGMLVNPMVFNDIPASQPNAVGYSVEFAPIGSPVRPKMVTKIIGGSLEGQVKNMDYAYMNDISNLKMSFRDNRSTIDKYTTLDSGSIADAYDFNIFGKDILNTFSVKNATLSVGSDEVGEYLMVKRIDPSKEFYFSGGPTKQEIMDNGAKYGLYTLQTLAQSNLGRYSSGFYFKPSEYRYIIDGQSSENMIMGKDAESIGNNVFVNITDKTTEKLSFGYYSKANSDLNWVKIYSMRLMPGIVGKYLMEKPKSPIKENIQVSREYSVGNGSLICSATFSSIKEVVNNKMPLNVQCVGTIPPAALGTIVTIGKLDCYSVPSKVWFQVFDTENGGVVGMCSVETDGTFKLNYTNQVVKNISVYGST